MDEFLGADDWWNHAFGGLHVAGRTIASAFGGAGLADAAEALESPILPDWAKRGGPADIRVFDNVALTAVTAKKAAKTGKPEDIAKAAAAVQLQAKAESDKQPDVSVVKPDYIAIVHKNVQPSDIPNWVPGVFAVGVFGGKRFDGSKPVYEPKRGRPGKTFSFGYTDPSRVDVVTQKADGTNLITTLKDVRQIIFAGGAETVGDGKGNRVVLGDEPWMPKWYHLLAALCGVLIIAGRK